MPGKKKPNRGAISASTRHIFRIRGEKGRERLEPVVVSPSAKIKRPAKASRRPGAGNQFEAGHPRGRPRARALASGGNGAHRAQPRAQSTIFGKTGASSNREQAFQSRGGGAVVMGRPSTKKGTHSGKVGRRILVIALQQVQFGATQ